MDNKTELYLKNAYSRGFGYYMEVLFCKYLASQSIPYVHESNNNLGLTAKDEATYLSDMLRESLLSNNALLNLFAYHFPEYFEYDLSKVSRKVTEFNLKPWDANNFLGHLTKNNFIEVIRWENAKPIISEIKSSWGPFPNNKITISMSELLKLQMLKKQRIQTSLIYMVALGSPRFVEIPLESLHLPLFPEDYIEMLAETVPTINKIGRLDRYSRYYYTHNLTIPAEFRSLRKMVNFPEGMYSFKDLFSLIKEIESVTPVYYLPSKSTRKKIDDLLSENSGN